MYIYIYIYIYKGNQEKNIFRKRFDICLYHLYIYIYIYVHLLYVCTDMYINVYIVYM